MTNLNSLKTCHEKWKSLFSDDDWTHRTNEMLQDRHGWLFVPLNNLPNNSVYLFIIYLQFNNAFLVTQHYTGNEMIISKFWIWKDVEERGHDLILGTIPAFFSRDWEKPRKPPLRIAGLRAGISQIRSRNDDHSTKTYSSYLGGILWDGFTVNCSIWLI
jgi:hypothetical protein